MIEDDFGQSWAIKSACDDFYANAIVAAHQFPFISGQGTGFEQDFIGNSNFSDVMQQSCNFQNIDLSRFQYFTADSRTDVGNTTAVLGSVCVSVRKCTDQCGDRWIRDFNPFLGLGLNFFLFTFAGKSIVVANDSIASITLGNVQSPVCLMDQVLRINWRKPKFRDTDTDG